MKIRKIFIIFNFFNLVKMKNNNFFQILEFKQNFKTKNINNIY